MAPPPPKWNRQEDLPYVPPAKLNRPEFKFKPGWNNSNTIWELPDEQYTIERFEEQFEKYIKCLKFEQEMNFQDQTNCFWSDDWQYWEKRRAMEKKELDESVENAMKEREERLTNWKAGVEEEGKIIRLTRPIDFEDLEYVIDNYDYDPDDHETNNLGDTEAENFIRRKVVEFRKSIGKQI